MHELIRSTISPSIYIDIVFLANGIIYHLVLNPLAQPHCVRDSGNIGVETQDIFGFR